MAGHGNVVIAQSGGPTAVINRTLAGAINELKALRMGGRILGAKHGIEGIMEKDFLPFDSVSGPLMRKVAEMPGAALGSTRRKPSEEDCEKILRVFWELDVRYFFYIGGDDTARALSVISKSAEEAKQPLVCTHVPKTIDNDLVKPHDHSPGYGSAARFVALGSMGLDEDNRSMRGIYINVFMGKNAGFLTASTALARQRDDEGPHLLYLPEVEFKEEKFIQDIQQVYEELGRVHIAISEGVNVKDENGQTVPLLHKMKQDHGMDNFGGVNLSGSGALGDYLGRMVEKGVKAEKKPRVRSDTMGYLQRSFPFVVSEADAEEAELVGRMGVQYAFSEEKNASIALIRKDADHYECETIAASLELVGSGKRAMPPEFISSEGTDITQEFVDYATPLIGPMPIRARLL
ncbi:MAG: diphosphate--fructose-6-phosphate 1-phosphotransferase [Candidatus Micrarchaeota archaeon]